MPPLDSPISSYSDVTPQKRVITDVISLIDPSDAPAVMALGGLDGAAGKFRFVNWPSTTVEWLEDTLADLTDALNGSITSNATTITVDDASLFQEGQILLIDSEQMWVSSVNISTEVLTVTRNYSGTQATHADNATVEIVGIARLEGAESDDIAFTDRTVGSNYTQIFHKEIKVTRTQNQISQYGIDEEFDYQAAKAVPELMRLIEKQNVRGARKAGSATTPRAFGGFGTFITDNTVSAGGALVQDDYDEAMRLAYEDGGGPGWFAFVNTVNMKATKNFLDSSNFLRVDIDQRVAGMVVEAIQGPFGRADIVLDRWWPTGSIYLVDPDHAGYLTYYPFTQEPLAKTGDYVRGEVVGEFTLCIRQDKAHAVISGIT
jgi:hypothetical protein